MKKRLLTLATMMLCVVMMFSSCALFTPTVRFKNFVDSNFEPDIDPTPTSFKKLDVKGNLDSNAPYYLTGNLLVMSDTNKTTQQKVTTVYNFETDKTIWSGENSLTKVTGGNTRIEYVVTKRVVIIDDTVVSLALIEKRTTTNNGVGKKTETVYDITVLTESGAEVVALKDVDKASVDKSIWVAADLFCIQQKVYRIGKDGSAIFAFDWSNARKEPSSLLEKAGDYYVDSYYENESIFIYDDCLNLTATYIAPVYSFGVTDNALGEVIFNANALSNGNVLVQYLVRQDAMAQKYSFLLEGEKFNIYSVLVEAKSGKTKKLDLNYLIAWVDYGSNVEYMGVGEKVDNVAVGYLIENQRINRNEIAAKVLSVKNNGHIAGVLDVSVPGAVLDYGFEVVAHNRWEVETADGRKFIVDQTGEIVGEDFNVDQRNAELFITNKRIYSWDFEMKYDLTKEKATDVHVMNHSVLFKTEKGEVKLYVGGEVKTLISEAEAKDGSRFFCELSNGVYLITDVSGLKTKYEIYNDLGVLLDTITDDVSIPTVQEISENGVILLSAKPKDNSATVYYRIA